MLCSLSDEPLANCQDKDGMVFPLGLQLCFWLLINHSVRYITIFKYILQPYSLNWCLQISYQESKIPKIVTINHEMQLKKATDLHICIFVAVNIWYFYLTNNHILQFHVFFVDCLNHHNSSALAVTSAKWAQFVQGCYFGGVEDGTRTHLINDKQRRDLNWHHHSSSSTPSGSLLARW